MHAQCVQGPGDEASSCVEVVLDCRVLHYIVSSALSLVCLWSEEMMLTLCVEDHPRIFPLT